MSVLDSFIDCLSNCEGLYPIGSGRDRCYEVCLGKAEKLLELGTKDGSIPRDDAERLRSLLSMCGLSIGKVEDLRKYCIDRYEELSRAPQQSSKNMEMPPAQSRAAEEQLPSRLVDCYQYCVKYHSDNPAALQGCRSMCDAMWKPSIQRVDIE
uniref:hypothetical protein n=1 Tax=Vulcanisaeta sp. JCM 16159 TaxID=1295371 RepID=UPI000A537EE5